MSWCSSFYLLKDSTLKGGPKLYDDETTTTATTTTEVSTSFCCLSLSIVQVVVTLRLIVVFVSTKCNIQVVLLSQCLVWIYTLSNHRACRFLNIKGLVLIGLGFPVSWVVFGVVLMLRCVGLWFHCVRRKFDKHKRKGS